MTKRPEDVAYSGNVGGVMVHHVGAPSTSSTGCGLESPHILGSSRLLVRLQPRAR